MSSIFLLLQKVHDKVHDLPMKLKYSQPKIYTGGIDINAWSSLSKQEKKLALEKDWYVYFSFRNPKTNKLVRQQNIKAGANRYKDKKTRLHILNILAKSLVILLEEGFDPYKTNLTLKQYLELKEKEIETEKTIDLPPTTPTTKIIPTTETTTVVAKDTVSIKEAFELALPLKQSVMKENSFSKFKSKIGQFERWLVSQQITPDQPISIITKKIVMRYLNDVLIRTSARNRNNTHTDLRSFFQVFEENELIPDNFLQKISKLNSKPERNKTYTPSQQEEIFEYLKENDKTLLLFIQFVSYNFLRPIEVCRLRIGDIDVKDKKLYVRAKNQPVKIKIIPNILLKELPDLSIYKKDDFLFTSTSVGGVWDSKEDNKRNHYSKKFKKVKDHFGLGTDYGLYSFRHTFITTLYREMAKVPNATPSMIKSKMQLITGHSTMQALELYLRDIDAALPEDYSNYFQ
ncbi:tyrosine-type recombinase/integrase [Cellulophaga fucicola]|uniref:Site-specific recombinase XerD n=1 Tax=Cellulophaga fucicola TaxID=76595 RepID=A0A1K1QXM8_9FLAO|nr:site-specific integrase [Cellulophaga fucicola]SFW64371.1 Site-specific recombinase XerD [Cellulophaga fucicola]